MEVLQEEPEQRQLQARLRRRGRGRRPVPQEVGQHKGPGDRPAGERRRGRLSERVRGAFVLEPVRGAGEGAAGALLHHAPLRHHARLLERLLVAMASRRGAQDLPSLPAVSPPD